MFKSKFTKTSEKIIVCLWWNCQVLEDQLLHKYLYHTIYMRKVQKCEYADTSYPDSPGIWR